MAIGSPGEVAQFLQFIGVNRPQANEDRAREFTGHVRDFVAHIVDTRKHHDEETSLDYNYYRYYGGSSAAGGRIGSDLAVGGAATAPVL